MQKNLLICVALACALVVNTSYAKEPKNLELVKASLIKYHDAGEYQKEQARVVDKAMQYLKTRLEKETRSKNHKKLAIVLDVDETALSNYPDMVKMSFGGSEDDIDAALNHGSDPVIAPTLELFRYAKANNVAVFFITARTEPYREATEKNLANAGYKNWDGLSFNSETYDEESAAPYKINARTMIEKQGYDIVLNIGDQQSDLTGGHADKTFKLPNPYYLIP